MSRQFTRTYDRARRAQTLRRVASKTEWKLWPYLRASQMGAPFRRQHPIGKWYADYCCVPLRLVIEIDGPLHDAAEDARRDVSMRELGFDVMRFNVRQIDEELTAVLEAIYAEVQRRLHTDKPPPFSSP